MSLATIKSLPVPVLKEEEMNDYLSLITPMISMIKSIEYENLKLAAIRQALLPKLMSGEIDVSSLRA